MDKPISSSNGSDGSNGSKEDDLYIGVCYTSKIKRAEDNSGWDSGEIVMIDGSEVKKPALQVSLGLCLSLRLMFKGLYLFTGGILFHVECCIR